MGCGGEKQQILLNFLVSDLCTLPLLVFRQACRKFAFEGKRSVHSAALGSKRWWFSSATFLKELSTTVVSPADKNNGGGDRNKANLLRLQDFILYDCCCSGVAVSNKPRAAGWLKVAGAFTEGAVPQGVVRRMLLRLQRKQSVENKEPHFQREHPADPGADPGVSLCSALPSAWPFYLPFHLSPPGCTTKPQVKLCFCWKGG